MALTTLPVAGAKLRASVLESLITELRPITARMSSDQALNGSSTVLQDVTALVVAVGANATYDGYLWVAWKLATGTAEDIKFSLSFPASSVCHFGGGNGPDAALGAATAVGSTEHIARMSITSGSTVISLGASTAVTGAWLPITLITAGTAGNLQVKAAQNTSGANIVTIQSGSKLILQRTA